MNPLTNMLILFFLDVLHCFVSKSTGLPIEIQSNGGVLLIVMKNCPTRLQGNVRDELTERVLKICGPNEDAQLSMLYKIARDNLPTAGSGKSMHPIVIQREPIWSSSGSRLGDYQYMFVRALLKPSQWVDVDPQGALNFVRGSTNATVRWLFKGSPETFLYISGPDRTVVKECADRFKVRAREEHLKVKSEKS